MLFSPVSWITLENSNYFTKNKHRDWTFSLLFPTSSLDLLDSFKFFSQLLNFFGTLLLCFELSVILLLFRLHMPVSFVIMEISSISCASFSWLGIGSLAEVIWSVGNLRSYGRIRHLDVSLKTLDFYWLTVKNRRENRFC